MDNTELLNQIQVVRRLRRIAGFATAARKVAYLQWQVDNKAVLDGEKQMNDALDAAEVALRQLTLEAYRETGNKEPAPGVSIRTMTHLEYDGQEALKWAMEHRIALRLDTPAFEKIAKASPLAFVTTTQEPKPMIAVELPKDEGEEVK